jgi:dTDP-D-glucose 4,6-dehydratase
MDSDPMALVRGNIPMNINVLDACHKNGVKKFVWLASTTGYPDTTEAVTEDMMFQGEPFEKYYAVGWVKRYTEVLCKLFAEKLKNPMPCVILRPSNIYGPNDKTDPTKSHVLSALMRKVVIKQNPIEVWGDGTDEKDVLYVDDMVDAMLLAAEKVEKFVKAMRKGYQDMIDDPQKSLDLLLSKQMKEYPLEADIEKASLDILLPLMDAKPEMFATQSLASWQQVSDWMLKNKAIEKAVDPKEAFVNVK